MTVSISKPAINLRERLSALANPRSAPVYETFWFSGDGSQTDFALPKGWKPRWVYADGALKRPGAGEDYEAAYDGFIHTVSFAVAPGTVDIGIIAERGA